MVILSYPIVLHGKTLLRIVAREQELLDEENSVSKVKPAQR